VTVKGVPVLTLWQPWASLVALGVKSIETRSWSTKYRGPLAIHAAARRVQRGKWIGAWHTDLLTGDIWQPDNPDVPTVVAPLGAIVATCTLVDVVPIREGPEEDGDDRWVSWHGGIEQDGRDRPWAFVKTMWWERDSDRSHLAIRNDQRPYGDFTPGRYAWLLADVVPVDPPAPFKGGRGLTRRWAA
jgi:activating signal cointegrator 1